MDLSCSNNLYTNLANKKRKKSIASHDMASQIIRLKQWSLSLAIAL